MILLSRIHNNHFPSSFFSSLISDTGSFFSSFFSSSFFSSFLASPLASSSFFFFLCTVLISEKIGFDPTIVLNFKLPALTSLLYSNSSLKLCSSFLANKSLTSMSKSPMISSSSITNTSQIFIDSATLKVRISSFQTGGASFVSFCFEVSKTYSPMITRTLQFMLPKVLVFLLMEAVSNLKERVLAFSSLNSAIKLT